jgi:hypothetical protein
MQTQPLGFVGMSARQGNRLPLLFISLLGHTGRIWGGMAGAVANGDAGVSSSTSFVKDP